MRPSRRPAKDPNIAQFHRLLRSLQHPLSPEGQRVLAAARVGLRLIREKAAEHRRARQRSSSRSRWVRSQRLTAIRGGTPVREDRLPGRIQEMLAKHRLDERLKLVHS